MKKVNKIVFRSVFTAVLLVLVLATPASAHPYVFPNAIAIQKPVSLLFTVYSEGSPTAGKSNTSMTGVEVNLPSQFHISDVTPPDNWKVTHNANPIALSGPAIPLGSVAVFNVSGTPTQLGKIQVLVTTITNDGTRVVWDGTNFHTAPVVDVVRHVSHPGKAVPVWLYFVPSIGLLTAIGGIFFFFSRRDRHVVTTSGTKRKQQKKK